MVARAPTGSGKSAAFLLPLLQKIWIDPDMPPILDAGAPRALILVPTRELAGQLWIMSRNLQPPKTSPPLEITGGVPYPPQFRALERPQPIIIATPGRLTDLVNDGRIDLTKLELLVLDEADRMLEMGFTEDLDLVLSKAPRGCQKILFSATMPRWVERAANRFLNEPAEVQVGNLVTAQPNIEQGVYWTAEADKLKVLKTMLEEEDLTKVIVFTNTKMRADLLDQELRKAGIRAVAIHGDHGHGQRRKALARFRNDEVRVLIGSDVAARGVDLPQVSHVINYDLPREFETYVHRIGRTGRANSEGVAISLADRFEGSMIRLIQKKYEMDLIELGNDLPPAKKRKKGEKKQDFRPTWNNRPDSRRGEDEREDRAYKTGYDPAEGRLDSAGQRVTKERGERPDKRRDRDGGRSADRDEKRFDKRGPKRDGAGSVEVGRRDRFDDKPKFKGKKDGFKKDGDKKRDKPR